MTHNAIVRIGIDDKPAPEDKTATVTIHCIDCGGEIEFDLPAVHLATLANACIIAAKEIGVTGITERMPEFKTNEADKLDAIRRKAHLN